MTTIAGPPIQLVRRTARVAPPSVPEGAVAVAAPPRIESTPAGAAGWLQYLFPVVGSLGGMLFIVNNPKPLFLASGVLFMLGSIGMGVGMGVQQRLTGRRRVYTARARYMEYLAGLRSDLQATAAAQRASSTWRHPSPDALLAVIQSSARLWERRPHDADFLVVRVGDGRRPLATPLEMPIEKGPAQALDPVCAAAAGQLLQALGWVSDDVVAVDLRGARVVSITGPRAVRMDVARALLCQLAVLHAPDEVRVHLCAASGVAPDWEWLKWLPHLGAGENHDDAAELDAILTSRVARARKVQSGVDLLDSGPWLVVISDGMSPAPEAVSLLRRVACQTTLISLGEGPADEPSEVDVRVQVGPGSLTVDRAGRVGSPVGGRPDRLGSSSAEAVARRLAPLRLSEEPGAQHLGDAISLAGLLGVSDVGALDPATAWRRRPLSQILRVPIGVGSDGEAVILDLKEAALGWDGPHGLVIGATGSGKSELLRTVVTGLALQHPPDLLAFVLVDFKGGAAFAGLQELPHVAGVITNLANDLAMVDRMHAALFGEIRRRQDLLRSAYLKVGTTVYRRFRAALVSEAYSPPSALLAGPPGPRPFRLIRDATASIAQRALDPESSGPTLLDVVVSQLRDAAPKAHQVWLPPLESRVSLGAVMEALGDVRPRMSVPIGLVDKPAEQSRDLLLVDLSGSAGHLMVAGASLSGKSTLLKTLIAGFALTHTPLEAQFYCIDYGGGAMSSLRSRCS